MASESEIERLRESVDIVDVIGEFVDLRKSGSNFKALSPFTNEKTPSFLVSPEKQIFKDFSSGKGGNVIRFLMDYNGWTFPETLNYLSEKTGIKLEGDGKNYQEDGKRQNASKALELAGEYFHKNLYTKEGEDTLNYFLKRGFKQESIKKFKLGYCRDTWTDMLDHLSSKGISINAMVDAGLVGRTKSDKPYDFFKGRAMFPIRNRLGKIVGFGGRTMDPEFQGGKYINTRDTLLYDKSKTIFGLYEAINEINRKDFCIITEGYADVISLHQSDYENTIASSGTALTPQQLDIIRRTTENIYLAFDSDSAGIKATANAIDLALPRGFDVKVIMIPDGDDPDSIIQKHGRNTFASLIRDAVDFVEFKVQATKKKSDINSPKLRSNLIRNIMKSIDSIPERLQHDTYIQKLSQQLNLTQNELQIIYNEKKGSELERIRSHSTGKKLIKNELEVVEDDVLQKIERELESIPLEDRFILKYALKSYSNFDALLEKDDFIIEDLKSNDSQEIINIIRDVLERDRDLINDFIDTEGIDQRIIDLVNALVLIEPEVNEKLAINKDISHRFDHDGELEEAIKLIKIRSINDKLKLLEERMTKEPDNIDLSQDYINLLNSRKKYLDPEDLEEEE